MVFTFEASVEIYDDDIDRMVKYVKEYGMGTCEAIDRILQEYGEYEYGCSDYYFEELRIEVERRLEENETNKSNE